MAKEQLQDMDDISSDEMSVRKKKVPEKRWEYDEQGYPTSYTLYDYTEEEPEMFVTVYRREYDSHGNWVKCTEYEVLGDRMFPAYTTVRTIDYF